MLDAAHSVTSRDDPGIKLPKSARVNETQPRRVSNTYKVDDQLAVVQ